MASRATTTTFPLSIWSIPGRREIYQSGALRVAITPLQPRVAFVAVCIAIAARNALGSLAIGEPLTVAFCIDIKISASLNQLLTSGRSFREIQTLEFARTIARFVKPDLYVF